MSQTSTPAIIQIPRIEHSTFRVLKPANQMTGNQARDFVRFFFPEKEVEVSCSGNDENVVCFTCTKIKGQAHPSHLPVEILSDFTVKGSNPLTVKSDELITFLLINQFIEEIPPGE